MQAQPQPRVRWGRRLGLLAGIAVLTVVILDCGYLLRIPAAAGALALDVLAMTAIWRAADRTYRRTLERGWNGRAGLWIVPLATLVIITLVTLGILGFRGSTTSESIKNALELPPHAFSRLVVSHVTLIFFLVGGLFLGLVGPYLESCRERPQPEDRWTAPAIPFGLTIIILMVLAWRLLNPDSLRFMSIWTRFRMERRPMTAVDRFRELLVDRPGADVSDAVLYRLGRLHEFSLLEYDQAIEAYDTLRDRHPRSPFADDALYESARIHLDRRRDPATAEPRFREFIARYPDSYNLDEAYLGLFRCLLLTARDAEAAGIKEVLLDRLAHRHVLLETSEEGRYQLLGVPVAVARVEAQVREDRARAADPAPVPDGTP